MLNMGNWSECFQMLVPVGLGVRGRMSAGCWAVLGVPGASGPRSRVGWSLPLALWAPALWSPSLLLWGYHWNVWPQV